MNNDPEYFPHLIFANLMRYANKWAQQYGVVQRITLHWCIDPAFCRSKYVRYVVVFELLSELHDDHPDFKHFLSNFVYDAAFDTLLDERFIDVYQREPDFGFRDEWDFLYKFSEGELPTYIEHENLWHLFPQQEEYQNLGKDREGPNDLSEKSIPIIKFFKDNDFWIIGKGDGSHFKDIDGMSYIHYLLEHPNKPISAEDLFNHRKGLMQSDNTADNYSKLTEAQLSEYDLRLEKAKTIEKNLDKQSIKNILKAKNFLLEKKEQINLDPSNYSKKADMELQEIERELFMINKYLKEGERQFSTGRKTFLNKQRVKVTLSIKKAIKKIANDKYLKTFINDLTIGTGYHCSYITNSENPVQWILYSEKKAK
jgi:hypothetical protein